MKKIFLVALLTFTSFANAEPEFKIELKEIDTTKYCVFEHKIYSLGSIVTMSSKERECRYFEHVSSAIKTGARWMSVK